MKRVFVYVDGFNLYFGIREAGLDHCRWLDVRKLAATLVIENQQIVGIKYFTSRVSNDPSKQKRQTTYLEALDTLGIDIVYGHYQQNTVECKSCASSWHDWKEKMTDVNIATHMIVDAYQDKYDTAILVSGDSDLVPPIRAIHSNFPSKNIFVAFPPKRHNVTVANAAKGSMIIGRKKLADSQLPDEVEKRGGFVLRKPLEWAKKSN